MRLRSALISLSFTALAACGSDVESTKDGQVDAATAEDSAEPVTDTTVVDSGVPETWAVDVAPRDTMGPGMPNPQADAYRSIWRMGFAGEGHEAVRVLGVRYVSSGGGGGGGGGTTTALVFLELPAGASSLDAGDGDLRALPGTAHRLVVLSLDPLTGAIREAEEHALEGGESVGAVTKAGAGFAATIVAAEGDFVVMGQAIGTTTRLTTIRTDGSVRLPASADMKFATSTGVTSPLTLGLDVAAATTLTVTSGDSALSYDVPAGKSVGFLSLATRATVDDVVIELPGEGSGLHIVAGLVPESTAETSYGPAILARVEVATTIGETELAPGERGVVVGVLTQDQPLDGVLVWRAASDAGDVEPLQLAGSNSSGIVLAGIADGELQFGPDTLATDGPRGFIATLGSQGGLLYEAPDCDQLLAVSVGFTYRILKVGCDINDEGPGLALTTLSFDFGGNLQEPIDQLLVPLEPDETPELLTGVLTFTVAGGSARGALLDFGEGPRLVLVRGDDQPYDSGHLEAFRRSGASTDPLFFIPLRQGGGGGGGATNPNTNAVLYAVPTSDGPFLGRARIDLKTLIW